MHHSKDTRKADERDGRVQHGILRHGRRDLNKPKSCRPCAPPGSAQASCPARITRRTSWVFLAAISAGIRTSFTNGGGVRRKCSGGFSLFRTVSSKCGLPYLPRTTSRRSAWRRSTRTPRTSPTASSASSSARWPRAAPLSEHPTCDDAHPVGRSARLRRPSSVGVFVCV